MSYEPSTLQSGGSIQPPTLAQSGSLSYESYYELRERPFSLSADPRFLYRSGSHAPAFDDLLTGIGRREGLIVLTGDIGTGKTTLCRAVIEHLDRKTFVAFVPDPFASREDLLKTLLVDFGVVSVEDLRSGRLSGTSRLDLSYLLSEFLDSLVPLQAFAVLIIDEAQNLSAPLLEEIRILSDLERRQKLLQVVLVGQLELQMKLKLPEMRQVDQRVSVRCKLEPLSWGAVEGYIAKRLEVAGGRRIEFSLAAFDAVYRGSGGVPRLINLICDRALQYGCRRRTDRIDLEIVSSAVVDLGLSPPSGAEGSAPGPAPQPPQIVSSAVSDRVSPASAAEGPSPGLAPQPRVGPQPGLGPQSRGWFEKGTSTKHALHVPIDVAALLAIPSSSPQTGQRAAPPDSFEVESFDPGRPESSAAVRLTAFAKASASAEATADKTAVKKADATGAGENQASEVQSTRNRGAFSQPRWAFVAAALLAAVVGGVGVALGYWLRAIESSAEVSVLTDPPPPLKFEIPTVRISPRDPDLVQETAATPVETATARRFIVQVAAFESSAWADRVVAELRGSGYPAYRAAFDPGDGRPMESVRIRYRTLADAEAGVARMRQILGYRDASILLPSRSDSSQ
jgi:type II secretory pathway predicted ATPase ExeA